MPYMIWVKTAIKKFDEKADTATEILRVSCIKYVPTSTIPMDVPKDDTSFVDYPVRDIGNKDIDILVPRLNSTKLYVKPGSNGNGTEKEPFDTVAEAQREVRNLFKNGDNNGITIYLMGGVYDVGDGLEFTNEDLETFETSVFWEAYNIGDYSVILNQISQFVPIGTLSNGIYKGGLRNDQQMLSVDNRGIPFEIIKSLNNSYKIGPNDINFQWSTGANGFVRCELIVAEDADFNNVTAIKTCFMNVQFHLTTGKPIFGVLEFTIDMAMNPYGIWEGFSRLLQFRLVKP